MAKAKELPRKCSECIHENACVMWGIGGRMAESNAMRCPNYETVKDSAAYLIGKLDGRKEANTNAECNTCACAKVCNHNIYGFENCGNYIPRW